MTKFTKILAAVAMLWLVAVHATPLMAQQYDFKVGQLYYKITDATNHEVAVVPEKSSYPYYNYSKPTGAIAIPATVANGGNTYSVTSIGQSAFSYCSGLTSINIPSSITSIGRNAFSGCSGLTSINIPNSITSIGQSAFSYCSGLTSINIPSSVTSIGESAFYGCTSLTSINIPSSVTSIGESAFYGCTSLTSINIPSSVTSIGQVAFYGCSGLTSITIPSGITKIGNGTFYKCTSLASVNLPSGLDSIGSNNFSSYYRGVFEDCTLLTSINIPNSVKFIGEKTFSKCSGLTSITIPNSVTSIGQYAFSDCSGLRHATIPGHISFKDHFGIYSNIDTVVISNGSTTIPLFSECSKIKYISIPNSITSIGGGTFSGCTSLTSINIPSSVTSIGGAAFENCRGLTSINIPSSVTSIGQRAFSDCSGLTSINIPSSITKIESGVFSVCSGLTSINIPSSVTSIGQYAFDRCNRLESINIPSSVTSIGQYAFRGSSLRYVTIPGHISFKDNFSTTSYIDTVIISSGSTTIPNSSFKSCSKIKYISIPNSVTSIGNYAFSDCSGLTSINIPNSVTKIEGGTFRGCSGLTSINIPSSVTSIGGWAFAGCTGLTSITIPSSVTKIVNGTFYQCTSLTSVNLPSGLDSIGSSNFYSWDKGVFEGCTSLTSINIPNSVKFIGKKTFSDCSGLSSINIPSSVTSIGQRAFYRCSGLDSVSVHWQTPLQVDTSAFGGVTLSNVKLIVPQGTTSRYQTADVWKDFSPIVERVSISVTYNQSAGGTFTLKNGSQYVISGSSVTEGTVLTVEATPAQSYKLDSIRVNGTRISGLSFMVEDNTTVEAFFNKIKHTITYTQPANGTLTVKDGTQTIVAGDSVEYGTVLTVEATPYHGYMFDSIKVNGARIAGDSFTVDSNSTVEAYFSKMKYKVTYTQPANGTLTVKNGSQTILSGDSLEYGTVLTIKDTPAQSYKLDSIRVNGTRISGLSFMVEDNTTVEAFFSKVKHIITYNQLVGGTLTVKNGLQTIHSGDSVEYGTVLTVEATPAQGYKLNSIKVNGARISGLSFTVNSNSTVEAYFSKMKYTVTYTQPANGTLTVKNGSQTIHSGDSVEYGTVLIVEATPYHGYMLDSIKVNGARIAGDSFTVDSNSTVEAFFFSKIKYPIIYNQPVNGTLAVKNGSQTILSGDLIEYGTVLTIEATPYQGYKLDSIHVNGDTILGFSFTVRDYTIISAFFSENHTKYTISYTQPANGTLAVKNGSQTILSGDMVEYGTVLTIEAIPYQGYKFDSIRINGTRISGLSFTVTDNTNIEVFFGKQSYTVTYNSNMYSGKIEVTRGSEIVASGSSVEYGTQLMVRAIPNHGFEVKSLTINDQAIVNNFVFSISESVEIKAVFAPTTTALDEAATKPLTIYPNPVAEVLYLSAKARTIRIYDMYGTEVAHATDTDKVEVSHLPAGVYTVRADGSIAKMIKR